ncbi:hypothetical protein [Komagataeibacter xylinus]|uniref:hypothetical protein n=1 Tax=Komagataeibacter xylinus TaxID=28448 RepID=UPI0011B576D0|nr:hypothetical protein [Komagataeibacter xylinus]GBQ75117.1 hypothetical protein AA15237_2039 [Komagataeibacter xylinus NBRC 15237]
MNYPVDKISLIFKKQDQSIKALQEASYRMIGTASCQIISDDESYICLLSSDHHEALDKQYIENHFLNLVTDENLRAKIHQETEGTRNLILALAFGALAEESELRNV